MRMTDERRRALCLLRVEEDALATQAERQERSWRLDRLAGLVAAALIFSIIWQVTGSHGLVYWLAIVLVEWLVLMIVAFLSCYWDTKVSAADLNRRHRSAQTALAEYYQQCDEEDDELDDQRTWARLDGQPIGPAGETTRDT